MLRQCSNSLSSAIYLQSTGRSIYNFPTSRYQSHTAKSPDTSHKFSGSLHALAARKTGCAVPISGCSPTRVPVCYTSNDVIHGSSHITVPSPDFRRVWRCPTDDGGGKPDSHRRNTVSCVPGRLPAAAASSSDTCTPDKNPANVGQLPTVHH